MIGALASDPFCVVAVVPADEVQRWLDRGWRAGRSNVHTVTCTKRFDDEGRAWRAARKLQGVVWSLEPDR